MSADETATAAGLTSQEAERRLQQFGPNDPAPPRRSSAIRDLLRLFLNPLVLILLIAAFISAFLGEAVNAGIIFMIVLLSVAIDFAQTYRSNRAVEQLRERVAPTATALRDGQWQEIPRNNVVPGDVLRLSAGDLVPADARLLASRDLYIQQAALTGESLPVAKEASGIETSTRPDAPNMVFLGTSVVSGTATALVVATGTSISFGDIATRLTATAEETAFDRGLKDFSLMLTRTVFFLVIFLLVVSFVLHRPPLESLLFAVALAVGLTPEFLPMITSVTLSKGARTFYVLLHYFHADEVFFHTGWFVESLATQTLVIFVIRTTHNPIRSRPSGPLTCTTLAIVAAGVLLPFSPLAGPLGFAPLPAGYFAFLATATLIYLLLVQIGKRLLLGQLVRSTRES